jgi:hypothetical protein
VPPNAEDLSFLQELPNLEFIGTSWEEDEMTAQVFWETYGENFK